MTESLRSISKKHDALRRIYSSNLVYVPDCWKLCGDAHCCGFSRYKTRFKILTNAPFQALPLLPGEYEFLAAEGLLEQFGEHEHRVNRYAIEGGLLTVEEIVSRRPGCCCSHHSRTTVCRLYPLYPTFAVSGALLGFDDQFGMFEELESLDQSSRACQISAVPFDQLNILTSMANTIGSIPEWVFYVSAYAAAKQHVFRRVKDTMASSGKGAFESFEVMYFMRRLFDHAELKDELSRLANEFREYYGSSFALEATG